GLLPGLLPRRPAGVQHHAVRPGVFGTPGSAASPPRRGPAPAAAAGGRQLACDDGAAARGPAALADAVRATRPDVQLLPHGPRPRAQPDGGPRSAARRHPSGLAGGGTDAGVPRPRVARVPAARRGRERPAVAGALPEPVAALRPLPARPAGDRARPPDRFR